MPCADHVLRLLGTAAAACTTQCSATAPPQDSSARTSAHASYMQQTTFRSAEQELCRRTWLDSSARASAQLAAATTVWMV